MGKAIRRKHAEAAAKAVNLPAIFAARMLKPTFSPFDAIRGYEQFALRPLSAFVPKTKSKSPAVRTLELVRYAFNRYPVSNFLRQVWFEENKIPWSRCAHHWWNPKGWYIALTQGRSLYKEFFKGTFTKQETHLFSTCPHDLKIDQALWWAITRSSSLIRTRLVGYPPDVFHRSVARWFIEHSTSAREIDDLLDYIENRHAEHADWHLRDHTLPSLRRAMNAWHRELGRVSTLGKRYPSWAGIALPDAVLETIEHGNHFCWQFKQIKTGRDLAAEGNRMHHCVASYAARCYVGASSIWSLIKWDAADRGWHQLTIEVSHGVIVQARGFANRLPTSEELKVVKQWANQSSLSINLGPRF